MIVATNAFGSIYEILSITKIVRGVPDDVLQPAGAHVVTSQLEVLISHHVQQEHRANAGEFIAIAQLSNITPAAVGIVWRVRLAALLPPFAERLFTVEKYEPISKLW